MIRTSRVRAATRVRVNMLSNPFTRTSRKKPTSQMRQTIGVVCVPLFGAMSRAVLAWRASMQIAGNPSRRSA